MIDNRGHIQPSPPYHVAPNSQEYKPTKTMIENATLISISCGNQKRFLWRIGFLKESDIARITNSHTGEGFFWLLCDIHGKILKQEYGTAHECLGSFQEDKICINCSLDVNHCNCILCEVCNNFHSPSFMVSENECLSCWKKAVDSVGEF